MGVGWVGIDRARLVGVAVGVGGVGVDGGAVEQPRDDAGKLGATLGKQTRGHGGRIVRDHLAPRRAVRFAVVRVAGGFVLLARFVTTRFAGAMSRSRSAAASPESNANAAAPVFPCGFAPSGARARAAPRRRSLS